MARRVMEQLRGELYLDQRYLTAALGALPAAPRESGGSFATDGGALYYPTAWLLDTYRRNRRYLPRAYLHSLFHCIFRHLWLRDRRDPDLWGLACDIAVEATLDTLNLDFEKLLDSVFKDTALDVSSDISVLNTLLAQEGLTEDEFSRLKKQQNPS